MHVVILKVIYAVWVLLGIMDGVLAGLGELVQFAAPLAVKYARNSKENAFIVEDMATEHVIVFFPLAFYSPSKYIRFECFFSFCY